MVYNFFDKKSGATHADKLAFIYIGTGINSDIISEIQQLVDELNKVIIKKFKKRIVYSSFKDNVSVQA